MNMLNMIRNNDTLQLADVIVNVSNSYLKKQRKKVKRNVSNRRPNNNIPNLNFYFMNGKPHIGDNSNLNIPTLNEIQNINRNLQDNINNRLNQILQNPVRNNDEVLQELRDIRGVQNDITNRILPNIGQALERGNALNEAGLVINSSNPVGVNPNGVNLRRAQQEQVIPILENLQQHGPINPYLNQLLDRARQLPNQYNRQDDEPRRPSQPPPPPDQRRGGIGGNMSMISRSQNPGKDSEDESSDDEQDINFSMRSGGINRIDFSMRSPAVISSRPNPNVINMQSRNLNLGGPAGARIEDLEVRDDQDRVLSPRGVFEDRQQ